MGCVMVTVREMTTDLVMAVETQAHTVQQATSPDPLLAEYYRLLTKHVEFLKQAVQVMPKLLKQIEAKARKTGTYKQAAYELDLAMYKQKVDMYQLHGQQLNALLPRLVASLR